MKIKSIKNSIDNSATIICFGGIGEKLDGDAIANEIINYGKDKNLSHINLKINSAGGNVIEGLSVVSAIINSPIPVYGYNEGVCASMAGIILMACNKIFMADYSQLMIHSPSIGSETIENTKDKKTKQLLLSFRDSLAQIIQRRTGKSVDEIYNIMNAETWYNAKQAKENNLIDEIINYTQSPKITNTMTTNQILESVNNFAFNLDELNDKKEVSMKKKQSEEEEKGESDKEQEQEEETGIENKKVKSAKKEVKADTEEEAAEEKDEEETDEDASDDINEDEDDEEEPVVKPKAKKAKSKVKKANDDANAPGEKRKETYKLEIIKNMEVEIDTLKAELDNYKNMYNTSNKLLAEMIVNDAIQTGKLSPKNREELVIKAAKNVVEFKSLMSSVIVKAPSITNIINTNAKSEVAGVNSEWTLIDYMKKDPKALENIVNTNPDLYAEMYKKQYGVTPSNPIED